MQYWAIRQPSAPTVLFDTGASISDDTIPDSQQSAEGEAQGKYASLRVIATDLPM